MLAILQECECFSVELDAEIAAMLRPGMLVEGTFGLLSDGSWFLCTASRVWPSFRFIGSP